MLSTRIKNAAPLVAIALGLLTLFTNRRLDKLGTQRSKLKAWTRSGVAQAAVDGGLLLLTAAVLVSISPLIVEAWPPDPGREAAVIRNLLYVATLGLLGLIAVQGWLVGTRIVVQTRNSLLRRRNR